MISSDNLEISGYFQTPQTFTYIQIHPKTFSSYLCCIFSLCCFPYPLQLLLHLSSELFLPSPILYLWYLNDQLKSFLSLQFLVRILRWILYYYNFGFHFLEIILSIMWDFRKLLWYIYEMTARRLRKDILFQWYACEMTGRWLLIDCEMVWADWDITFWWLVKFIYWLLSFLDYKMNGVRLEND